MTLLAFHVKRFQGQVTQECPIKLETFYKLTSSMCSDT